MKTSKPYTRNAGAITPTTDRATLIAALADARTENELLRRQAANRILRRRRSQAESRERRAQREDRAFLDQLREARDNTPADRNAELHRRILLDALKGTP